MVRCSSPKRLVPLRLNIIQIFTKCLFRHRQRDKCNGKYDDTRDPAAAEITFILRDRPHMRLQGEEQQGYQCQRTPRHIGNSGSYRSPDIRAELLGSHRDEHSPETRTKSKKYADPVDGGGSLSLQIEIGYHSDHRNDMK